MCHNCIYDILRTRINVKDFRLNISLILMAYYIKYLGG